MAPALDWLSIRSGDILPSLGSEVQGIGQGVRGSARGAERVSRECRGVSPSKAERHVTKQCLGSTGPSACHWGLPDPVKATGTDAERALVFAQTYAALRRRIAAFVSLPFAELNRLSLQARVDAIGQDTTLTPKG